MRAPKRNLREVEQIHSHVALMVGTSIQVPVSRQRISGQSVGRVSTRTAQ